VYFTVLFVYFLLVFDPPLYAHHHQPVFLVDRGFFQESLRYPGGLIELATQFLFQFFCFRLPGSVVLAAVSLTILALVHKLLRDLGDRRYPLGLACLPVVLFLTQQNHYSFPLVIGVKYSCVLACLILYTKLASWRKTAAILLSGLVYLTLGGWWFLLYSTVCAVHQVLYSKGWQRYLHAALSVAAYMAYPLLAARFLFVISPREAYFHIVPSELYQNPHLFRPDILFCLYCLALPLLLLGYWCYARLPRDRTSGENLVIGEGGLGWQTALVTLASLGALMASRDADEKRLVQVDLLATEGRWPELVAVSREISHGSRLALFQANRALYHTGQLLENMFSFRQSYGVDGLFLGRITTAGQITLPSSDLYLDLGHVKASQVMAYEGQTRQRYSPRILKRLAMTNIISGNTKAASMFLSRLDRTILHRGWARSWRTRMAAGEPDESGDLIQSKRSQMPQADFFINRSHPNKDLLTMLMEDGDNRMALEYLLAYYLLEGRLGDLLVCLKGASLGATMPRHIEEALILIKATRPEALTGTTFRLRPDTVKRFVEFNKALEEHSRSGEEMAAREALQGRFGDTFWYYVRYISPEQAQSQLKTRRIDAGVF